MNTRLQFSLAVVLLVAGCANPLNQATSDRYAAMCAQAEARKDLATAEEACYRAAVNTEWGNLGNAVKSERYYNLGRIKRKIGKYEESITYLKQALSFQETASTAESIKVGRRLAELSAAYFQSGKADEGLDAMQRLQPLAEKYAEYERWFVGYLFFRYGQYLESINNTDLAESFFGTVKQLGYTEADFVSAT